MTREQNFCAEPVSGGRASKIKKRFGFRYWRMGFFGSPVSGTSWHKTAQGRDQAIEATTKKRWFKVISTERISR